MDNDLEREIELPRKYADNNQIDSSQSPEMLISELQEKLALVEAKSKENTQQLELALEASQMGIWEVNLLTGELNWPPQSLRLLGLKRSDKISFERFMKMVHPDDRALLMRANDEALKNKPATTFEHRIIWPDGSVHWFLVKGKAIFKNNKPLKIIGAAINIDDLKKAQAALEESEKQYQAFISNSNEGIWRIELDKPISTKKTESEQIKLMYKYAYFAEANDAMAKMYGMDSGKALKGARLSDILIESDPNNTAYLKAFIKEGYSLSGAESHELDIKGRDKYFLNSMVGVVEKDLLLHAWGTQQDITDQHNAMEALKQREQQFKSMLDQQTALVELNDAKDEFISLASHQLRTPATGVKQFIGMLLENYFGKLTEDQRTMLEYAYESNERQLEVINDLLKVAQVDAGKVVLARHKTDIAKLLEKIMQGQRSQFTSRKQKVVLDRPKEPLYAQVDESRIRMVIENLVDNASKYTPDGKSITVTIDKTKDDKFITIKIKDEGVGIAKEDMPKLFQKFLRLDNPLSIQVGGTGIGLYWAKKIVDLHGGDIRLKSQLGKGTTFTVMIPT